MPGPRVVVFYEDATVGGLHGLVRDIATERRRTKRRPAFPYFQAYSRKNNAKLVRDCDTFAKVRFAAPHRADHVFAVIDAYRVEGVVPGVPSAPRPGVPEDEFQQYCDALRSAVTGHLMARAMSDVGSNRQKEEATRFHPHVLFWERETVVLAGAETLARSHALTFPDEMVSRAALVRRRNPASAVEQTFREQRDETYQKAIDGPDLLGRIAEDRDRWDEVLDRVPSLGAIVEDLVAL